MTEIVCGPILLRPSNSDISILWITDAPCTSFVRFGKGSKLNHKAQASHHGLIDALTKIHRVRLAGLEAGQTYSYQVVSKTIGSFLDRHVVYSDEVESPIHTFTTFNPEADHLSFISISDLHGAANLLDRILAEAPLNDVDFVVFNGDMVDSIEEVSDIQDQILQPAARHFAHETPLVFVRGNHETRGPYARDLPNYLLADGEFFYYGFRHGPAYFSVMDSGEDKVDSHAEYSGLADFDPYRTDQAAWLHEDLKKASHSSAEYHFVFSHMPPYGGNDWHGEQQIRSLWVPILDEYGCDVVLSGHTHEYAYLPSQKTGSTFDTIIAGLGMYSCFEINTQEIIADVRWIGGYKIAALQIK